MIESSPNGIDLNVIDFCTPVVFQVRKDDDDDDDGDLHLCALSQHPRKNEVWGKSTLRLSVGV